MEEPLMQLNSSITPTRTVMTYSHRNCPSHPIQSQAGGNGAEGLMQEADEKPFELKGLDIVVPKDRLWLLLVVWVWERWAS
jgi:hypothetical protein